MLVNDQQYVFFRSSGETQMTGLSGYEPSASSEWVPQTPETHDL